MISRMSVETERLAVMPPQGRRAWADLKDPVTSNAIKAALINRVGQQRANQLQDYLNYKSVKNVKTALNNVASAVQRQVGSKRYALIQAGEKSSRRSQIKSTHWLAEVLASKLGRWPDVVVDSRSIDDLVAVMRRGIRTFVLFDDGIYSGMQAVDAVQAFNEAALRLRGLDRTTRVRDNTRRPLPRLLVAVGFLSSIGEQAVEYWSKPHSKTFEIVLLAGRRFRNVPNSLRQGRDFNDYIRPHHTLAMLAHKLPNEQSIPKWLHDALREKFPTPPYKKLYNKDPMPTGYNKAYWTLHPGNGTRIRYFVKGPHHEAFQDVGGRLERRPNLNKNVIRMKENKLKRKSNIAATQPDMPSKRRKT
jgi:hypothetical protein